MTPTVLTALLLSAPANFEALKSNAKAVPSLKQAVAAFVGRCADGDPVENASCRANLQERKAELGDRSVYLFLGTPEPNQLRYGGERGDKVRLLWTPVLDPGGGFALTVGKPSRIGTQGGVVVPTKVLDLVLAAGQMASDVERLARIGQLSVEVIGRFEKPWRVSGKGKTSEGVALKLEALRVVHGRTGKPVASTP